MANTCFQLTALGLHQARPQVPALSTLTDGAASTPNTALKPPRRLLSPTSSSPQSRKRPSGLTQQGNRPTAGRQHSRVPTGPGEAGPRGRARGHQGQAPGSRPGQESSPQARQVTPWTPIFSPADYRGAQRLGWETPAVGEGADALGTLRAQTPLPTRPAPGQVSPGRGPAGEGGGVCDGPFFASL